jgi:nucleoside-diphosphate-sugar epimerase
MLKIGVTGANGFVGSRIALTLNSFGHEVVRLIRNPTLENDRQYILGEPVPLHVLADLDVVVHAAWDFSAVGGEILTANFIGSQPLIETASTFGVRVILISSLSAFDGCRSKYGLAKLYLEELVADFGGASIRAGVIFGRDAGGIFGSLRDSILLKRRSFLPIFSGGYQPLSVSWDKAVCEVVEYLVRVEVVPTVPVLAAHPIPVTLRSMIDDLSAAAGQRPRLVSIPWRFGWTVLRALELLQINPPFRSDSLLALVNPISSGQRSALMDSPIKFPSLVSDLWAT